MLHTKLEAIGEIRPKDARFHTLHMTPDVGLTLEEVSPVEGCGRGEAFVGTDDVAGEGLPGGERRGE